MCVCRYLGIDRDRQTDRQTDKQIDTYTFVIGYKNKNWVAATKKNGDLDQSLIQKSWSSQRRNGYGGGGADANIDAMVTHGQRTSKSPNIKIGGK